MPLTILPLALVYVSVYHYHGAMPIPFPVRKLPSIIMFIGYKLESISMLMVFSRTTILVPTTYIKFSRKMPDNRFIYFIGFQYNTIFELFKLKLFSIVYLYFENFTYFFSRCQYLTLSCIN